MSRRKQGRPQQRRALDSLEQENDLLVCGDCQTSFPLHDIVQFIRHKKQCCNKENVDNSDSTPRKPDSSNSHDTSADNNNDEGDNDDMDHEGVDMSKESIPREEGDEMTGDNDSDNEVDFDEVLGHGRLVDGDKKEVLKVDGKNEVKEENISSTSSSSREMRAPLRQRQVVDAESNTTHSEPSRFVCETCRSTYTSAWALLQHAQKEHGMKIYTSPNSTSSHYQHTTSSVCAPITSSMSPMNLMVATSPRSAVDHRSTSVGSAGSVSPYPLHAPNPFSSPFRLPLDSRLAHSTSISPFSRLSNFDFDLINDYRLRPQLNPRAAAGLDHPSFGPSPFDRARTHISPVVDSQYDFYSMRLKQLANSPVVSQSKSQFSASSHTQPPNFAVTPSSSNSESPPAEATTLNLSPRRSSSLTSALTLPPKQKACEFCGKTFRFQSNLVVHRRSHTGEKPYKCPRCPHACTQQSKLKRHMKTHSSKSDEEMSPSGLSIVKVEGDYNDEDVDDDEQEEGEEEEEEEDEDEIDEEEEEEEDIIEEEMNEEEREVLQRMKDIQDKEELTPEPGEICHDAKKIKLEHSSEYKGHDHNVPSDLSVKFKPAESLLSEVMKRTGLNDIQTYSEAYKAALAESQENGKSRSEVKGSVDSTSSDRADTPRTAIQKMPRAGVKRELESEKELDKHDHKQFSSFLGGVDQSKSAKRESAASSLWPASVEAIPTSNIDHAAASLYSRLHPSWFQADNPVRLYFPGYAPHFSSVRDLSLNPENHKGLNLSNCRTPTSSALKPDNQGLPALLKPRLTSPPAYTSHFLGTSSPSSSPTGSLVLPSNGGSAITPPRKDSRRNDTCEYCGKIFKNCSNLTVHRRSHTGEKPYKCNLCSYACAQSSKLTRHMKTHGRMGKDVYTCKFCNMPFSVPSTLEKHMRKCVENRNAGIMTTDDGDLSSESNGELSRQSDSASGVYRTMSPSCALIQPEIVTYP